jgi:hypothetical protein
MTKMLNENYLVRYLKGSHGKLGGNASCVYGYTADFPVVTCSDLGTSEGEHVSFVYLLDICFA